MKLGNEDITIKLGSNNVDAIYLGTQLVYSGGSEPPTPSYNNIITYSATNKLAETTTSGGLKTNAFSGSSGQLTITSHTFENGVGTIEFDGDVVLIGADAFYYSYTLTSIDIPSGVTIIGADAFKNCRRLTSVTVNAVAPPTLGSSSFDNTNNCPIYVPAESVDTYKAASGWSTYASRIQAIAT